jgi:hypothetical protein
MRDRSCPCEVIPDRPSGWQHGSVSRLPIAGSDDVLVLDEGDQVVANSWSCQIVTIDLATGLERARAFTK